jgi:hypothetical protein
VLLINLRGLNIFLNQIFMGKLSISLLIIAGGSCLRLSLFQEEGLFFDLVLEGFFWNRNYMSPSLCF